MKHKKCWFHIIPILSFFWHSTCEWKMKNSEMKVGNWFLLAFFKLKEWVALFLKFKNCWYESGRILQLTIRTFEFNWSFFLGKAEHIAKLSYVSKPTGQQWSWQSLLLVWVIFCHLRHSSFRVCFSVFPKKCYY